MAGFARNPRSSRLTVVPSVQAAQRQARLLRLSHLRKLRQCEQVAAVCYRRRGSRIEFLLVRTGGGQRWTFPKGSAEPGLTHAQAAALEAFEEAGVHGRIEERSFARYLRRGKSGQKSSKQTVENKVSVNAHLCEVLRLSRPRESHRNRTWFCVQEARLRLSEGREHDDAAEFVRVIDRALARIQRIRGGIGGHPLKKGTPAERLRVDQPRRDTAQRDALQAAPFDFAQGYGRIGRMSLPPDPNRQLREMRQFCTSGVDVRREAVPCEVLEFGPRDFNPTSRKPAGGRKPKALAAGPERI